MPRTIYDATTDPERSGSDVKRLAEGCSTPENRIGMSMQAGALRMTRSARMCHGKVCACGEVDTHPVVGKGE